MSDKTENPPAFPGQQAFVAIPSELKKHPAVSEIKAHCNGMTLRDYFAAAALQGYLSPEMLMSSYTEEDCELRFLNYASFSYRMADAMLAARQS